MIKRKTGHCPETGEVVTITIEFSEIFVNGKTSPEYVKMGYSCDHSSIHGCVSAGETGEECPIYKGVRP